MTHLAPRIDTNLGSRWMRVLEASRYLLASIAALALDATLLWAFHARFGQSVWLSGAIGYASGLVLIYLLSVHWVFSKRAIADRRTEFALFAGLGLVGLLLNSITLSIATSAGATLALAKGLSAAVGFVANYLSRRAVLFSFRVR